MAPSPRRVERRMYLYVCVGVLSSLHLLQLVGVPSAMRKCGCREGGEISVGDFLRPVSLLLKYVLCRHNVGILVRMYVRNGIIRPWHPCGCAVWSVVCRVRTGWDGASCSAFTTAQQASIGAASNIRQYPRSAP
ncbi:hypothetical protein SODALDRAFT_199982 [Sodiomyces alkalinus F11]|uniref:Uncharacterized protein n=1 Tax=Sodiomyces alkalinus (strain CBS 110278 / VKM F-3762 / F11) TaxID=1314773 RepID=A0A3N2PSR8_SODAK|nr:hypothetical protein SODALDRAFT_199982 [Sodiomyces alkalinus F11]ROT37561.1 hypothetical protein SODALDRAFT_199982 [Sodiomyces alkalinus F11]